MQALVLTTIKRPLCLEQRGDLRPGAGEVVVALKAAALNRRDYWIVQGLYPGVQTPVIPGSDGAGVVDALGDGVETGWLGRPVVINPGWDWGTDQRVQSNKFRILGMPDDGTFAEQVVVPAHHLYARPDHLNWQQAAALPLAGVTAFRALFVQGGLQAGQNVLVSGVGGGVATFALQYAVAAGAKVFVTSSSAAKIEKAVSLGATAGFNYTHDDWHKDAKAEYGLMSLIVDSGGGEGYAKLIDLAAPGGRIVNYGATAGPPKQFDLFKVFWKQLHLIGSTMGSPADFAAMLQFVNEHKIVPLIDQTFSFHQGNSALERMKHAQQFGKIVLDIEPPSKESGVSS